MSKKRASRVKPTKKRAGPARRRKTRAVATPRPTTPKAGATAAAVRRVAKTRNLTVGQVEALRTRRGLTPGAIRKVPAKVLQRAIRRLDYPDLPRAREAFRLLQERDERGILPPNALARALTQLDGVRARRSAVPLRVAGVPAGGPVAPSALVGRAVARTAGLHPGHTGWSSLGPGNIGGRTRAIVAHPTLANTMWAGSVGGGVWRSDNGGQGWARSTT